MKVTVVGCAGSYPNAESAASCYLLEAEGFRLVIDMGNGAFGALQRYVGFDEIDAVCVSHLHGDHCLDLGAFAIARHYAPGGPRPPVPLYGPRGTAERLAPVFGLVTDELGDRFTIRELQLGRTRIGPFAITTEHMNHPVETFGFRVEHAGWSLAYSADTGESDALVRLARDVDVLLCEASFLDEPDNTPDVHLSARQAGEHAAKAAAGKLVLTHLVALNDPAQSLAEATGAFGGAVSLAAPGKVFGPGAL
jgi:ribonuclease BN (tRNA processing enzyme)